MSKYFSQADKNKIFEIVKISNSILDTLVKLIDTTVQSPSSINMTFGKLCEEAGVESSFLGEKGPINRFSANLCVMKNEYGIHGLPFEKSVFDKEDIIHIDMGIKKYNFNTDHGVSIYKGVAPNKLKLIQTAKDSVRNTFTYIKAGAKVSDISEIIYTTTIKEGFSPVINFGGHGIGKFLHERPHIPFVRNLSKEKLEEGSVICIENWIAEGNPDLESMPDGWGFRTIDRSNMAFFEKMIYVDKTKGIVL